MRTAFADVGKRLGDREEEVRSGRGRESSQVACCFPLLFRSSSSLLNTRINLPSTRALHTIMPLSRLHALALILGVAVQLAFGQDFSATTQTYTITSDSIVYVDETIFAPDTTIVETTSEAVGSSAVGAGIPVAPYSTLPSSVTPPTTTRRSERSTSLLPTASGVSETSIPVSTGPSNTGAIAGGVVGGVAALGVGTALLLLRSRRRKRQTSHLTEELGKAAGVAYGVGGEKDGIQRREEGEEQLSGHTMMMRRE
ncbi:hypothetical protein BCR35DRAFT_303805 [Leucosporidium creatinivorum]|uniref:Uncharacterized protein n=1 Tax=Leucosporidium creatinivorum TaxID=106004 RepID=A0A1Y2FEP2_9BASI|nr:hypothetical protein BCR35DRAFT_303805 [Leucosporidium creatinivorum]